MTSKRCANCGLHFPKRKHDSMKEFARQECCSRRCAGVLREQRRKRKGVIALRTWQEGGNILRRVGHSKIPIVVAGVVVSAMPAVASAKGPIVRAAHDWWAAIWSILINNT